MKLHIEIEIGTNELMADYSDLSLAMSKLMREFDTAHRNGEVCQVEDGSRIWDHDHVSRIGFWNIVS